MRIRVGCKPLYASLQRIPMLLTLNILYTRAFDIVFADHGLSRQFR
jgi:hypothetical protein